MVIVSCQVFAYTAELLHVCRHVAGRHSSVCSWPRERGAAVWNCFFRAIVLLMEIDLKLLAAVPAGLLFGKGAALGVCLATLWSQLHRCLRQLLFCSSTIVNSSLLFSVALCSLGVALDEAQVTMFDWWGRMTLASQQHTSPLSPL